MFFSIIVLVVEFLIYDILDRYGVEYMNDVMFRIMMIRLVGCLEVGCGCIVFKWLIVI